MFAALYHWKVKDGLEAEFVEAWREITSAALKRCGSFGSRLHRAEDGTFFGYARWPDDATRRRCFEAQPAPDATARMNAAIAESWPEVRLDVVEDLLAEP